MPIRSRIPGGLSGIAGEYFAAAELSRRGYIASITLRNTRGVDILASNSEGTKAVAIQVKTRQGPGTDWMLNQKAEIENVAEKLFYIFVSLNGLGPPTFHIAPRNDVARFVKEDHAAWLKKPGRGGRAHRDTTVRKFVDRENRYRDRWDLLGLG